MKEIVGEELMAFKDFFSAFITAVKNASVYTSSHPLVVKLSGNLNLAVEKFAKFRKEIIIGITPEGLLIDGSYFQKGYKPYKDIALYLHYRYVERLKISVPCEAENLLKLINVLSLTADEIARGGGAGKIFSGQGGAQIEIKQLDYRVLLKDHKSSGAGAVKKEEDVWRFLLGDSVQDVSGGTPGNNDLRLEKAAIAINDSEKIRQLLNETGVSQGDAVSGPLLEIAGFLEKNYPEKSSSFVNNLVEGLLNADDKPLDNLSQNANFIETLKGFAAKHLEEGDLLEIVVAHIKKKKEIDGLLLNFLDKLSSGIKSSSGLDEALAGQINKAGLLEEAPQIRDSIERLFTQKPDDKFISRIYHENLSVFLQHESSLKFKNLDEYKDDLAELSIKKRYFNILFLILGSEQEEQEYERIVNELISIALDFLKDGNLSFIDSLAKMLLAEDSPECALRLPAKNGLEKILSSCEATLSENLFTYDEEQFKKAVDILSMREPDKGAMALRQYAELFFSEGPDDKKRERLIYLLGSSEKISVDYFKDFLNKDIPFERWVEVIKILKGMNIKHSLSIIFEPLFNKGNKMLSLEVLRSLGGINEKAIVDFLFKAGASSDYLIRREAFFALMNMQDPKINKRIVELLFVKNDFFGTKDDQIAQAVELAKELSLVEAREDLRNLSRQQRLFFPSRVKALREAAQAALAGLKTNIE